jgi:hypothetical protein
MTEDEGQEFTTTSNGFKRCAGQCYSGALAGEVAADDWAAVRNDLGRNDSLAMDASVEHFADDKVKLL